MSRSLIQVLFDSPYRILNPFWIANIAQHSHRGRYIHIQAQVSRHEETRTHGRCSAPKPCMAPDRDRPFFVVRW
jgi:hypothetical protein